MNKEFQQWLKDIRDYIGGFDPSIQIVYSHLQANPHLLREDGEKDDENEFIKMANRILDKRNNPRPTDMEQEAREMMKDMLTPTFYKDGNHADNIITESDAIIALTEFVKMWYERGREEEREEWRKDWRVRNKDWMDKVSELKQQLDEKDKEIDLLKHDKKCDDQRFIMKTNDIVHLRNQLTAAKEQIAKLEQQNADLELALRNL